ncbi:MAG: PASTA domain-containing protein, partial [Erysipelotrichaceae bacterium]|nr:PASTA domain-containing protein [Erysipelotrichaceae bacterium]
IEKWSKDNDVKYELEYQFDDVIEKGKVVSQSVKANQMIKSKDTLKIVISLGPDPDLIITLPDFTDYSYDQIVEFVEANKLLDVTYDYIEDEEVEEDIFIKHNIDTPTMKRSEMIIFTLSLGDYDESKEIEVPDFSTFTKNQISNWGSVNNVFIKFIETTSTTVLKGEYIKQSPVAGALIYERRTITITYSSGQPIKAIDLSGKTKIQVIQWLDDNDNRVYAKYFESYNDDIGKNIVINNSPNSGYLADGATISVYLSLGRPNLDSYIGKDYTLLSNAINSLNSKGAELTLDIKSQYDDTVEKGKLISQDKYGEITTRSKITAVYSKGKQITIIDQIGKTFSEFSSYCSTNKLLIGTKTEKYHDTHAINEIIGHTPAAGQIVDEGTKINYVLSLGLYTPESFIGKTYSYASEKIDEANTKDAGWTIVRVDEYNNSYDKNVIYDQSVSGKTLTV